MSSSHSSQLPVVALGAVASAAVAAGAIYASSSSCKTSRTKNEYHFIVFQDTPAGCSRNGKLIILPKQQVQQLQAVVCSALQSKTATLFLWDTKEKLKDDTLKQQLDQHLLNSSSYSSSPVILLIVSESGTLSNDAAALSPVRPPPFGPKPLPLVKNALLANGPYGAPFYNFWHNLFTPEKIEKWGETICYQLPTTEADRKALAGHSDDFEAAIMTNIQTCDADVLAELLDRQDDFPKMWNRATERALTRLGENGIFTSSTPSTDWQTVHGLFPRGFNQIKIQNAYFPIIVKKTNNFLAEWSRFEAGHLITGVNNWLACMTADAVIKATCNLDMDNIARRARGEAAHPVLETYRRIGAMSPATAKPWEVVGWANYLNPLYNTKAGQEAAFMQLKQQLQGMVDDVIEKTRSGELGDTLLGSLISDRSPTNGLYVRQKVLFSHFVNLLVAGHETTANTMGFLMYHLSQNPEWEERVRQEIRSVLGGRSELSASDIPKLVVTEACFKEALRLHPPAGQVGRDAAHDTVIKGQYLVRRGQRVQINLVALHRNPRYWSGPFGDANAFNPARFMPGAAEAAGRHPHAFKPFGFGVRACAGMQFALWEAKTLIPMLYHHFTFKLVDNFKLMPSRRESFPSPSAEGLAFHIYPAPGAPASVPKPLSTAADATPTAAAAAADTAAVNGKTPAAAALAESNVHNTPLLVLFGSNAGTCEAFAAELVESAAAAGFAASAATLDSVFAGGVVPQLPKDGAVLLVTSTYNGLPPDNAVRFSKWLQSGSLGSTAGGVVYSVLGVGNSQWVTYQAFPRLIDSSLAAAGAVRLSAISEADTEVPGFVDAAGEWWSKLCPLLLQHFNVAAPAGATDTDSSKAPRLHLAAAESGTEALRIKDVLMTLKAHGAGYDALKITASEELQQPGSGRFTKHVELQLPEHMTYTPGDHLEVLPRNAPALVDSALQLLGLSGDEVFMWTPNPQAAARGFTAQGPDSQADAGTVQLPLSSRDVLAWLVDLSAIPPMRTVAALAEQCPCPPEAMRLKHMATEQGYKDKVLGPQLTLLELLSGHRSLLSSGVDLAALAALLPRLAPRYYSISSSPAAAGGPHRASITVGLVEYSTPTGRLHQGAASSTIHRQQVGLSLAGAVRQLHSKFRLPADPSTPIIMIGPGTGVAPMIGFLEEREAQQQAGTTLSPAVLFFGCRNRDHDFIYQSRLEAWQSAGVLTDLQVAFSRQPGASKVYVQDLITASGQQIWQLLQQDAHVYVCGDAKRMAPDVQAAFRGIACSVGGMSEGAAAQWLADMREQHKYVEDVWAS